MKNTLRKFTNKDYWAYGLFWSWNAIFLAFMTLGFAPRILPEMILAVGTSTIPVSFLIYALVLTAIPVLSVILGLTLLRRQPGRLFALGYCVEGPLMLMLAIRFFLIREATSAVTLMLVIALLGITTFLWDLLDPAIGQRGTLAASLRLAGLTLMVLTSLYSAVWVAFYALPLAAVGIHYIWDTFANLGGFFSSLRFVFGDLSSMNLVWIPFTVLGFILLLYTATLFVLMPIAVPFLSIRAWWRTQSIFTARKGWMRSVALIAATLIACAALFIPANRQPQQEAFTLLGSLPASPADAESLLDQQDEIRAGLLNAYLAPFRYLSAAGEVFHIRRIYEDVFKMPMDRAAGVQRLYESVTRPLLYRPVHNPQGALATDNIAFRTEPQEAASLYQQFFDQPIVDGERGEIVQAVRETWSFNQAEAAWQAVDDREIHLVQQDINIDEHGDWADVELYEVYQNQTGQNQEVIYYFNLPESAVLTGLWLGNSPDRDTRYAFQVAPRGAAQTVYRNEVRKNLDPALLEQIGPRQYRLRVFPVSPVQVTLAEDWGNSSVEEGQPLYMWLTYQTLASEGSWPMPHLALKRNVYWDGDTVRTLNGRPMDVKKDAWLPESVPAVSPADPQSHRVDIPGSQTVLAVPFTRSDLPAVPRDLRLAVVLDRSRSMAEHADEVTAALSHLHDTAGPDASIDIYLTASSFRDETPSRQPLTEFDPQAVLYFGGQNAAELLSQYETLRDGSAYDAVLVFTDGSGYELGETGIDLPIPTAPVWMIHLGSDIPLGYDDGTLEAIQASGGGVVGDLDEALIRLEASPTNGSPEAGERLIPSDLVDGYVWTVLPTDQVEKGTGYPASDETFQALAARRLILGETQRQRENLGQVETLDQLHQLAQESGIVTPYSSMIVLVNRRQEILLEVEELRGDRFEREFEELGDTTPPSPMPLTGVPEPHEWLLLGLVVVFLGWYASRRRFAYQRR
jgi:putative PEP-CTERM system integral membrane protein